MNFANKLGIRHVDFSNQKMKVRLAAQVLSSSVADAIQFMKDSKVQGFEVTQVFNISLILNKAFCLTHHVSSFLFKLNI